MGGWFLNPALSTFRAEVNARFPNRDKTSDGTVGDPAHQATSSDHNPDPDGSVDAWDMDIELNGPGKPFESDLQLVINAALRHEATQYVIYNRQITSRTWGLGIWRDYDGPSPHDHHVHFNTRTAYENSKKPWLTEEEWMPTDDDFKRLEAKVDSIKTIANVAGYRVEALVSNKETYANQLGNPKEPTSTNQMHVRLDQLEAKVDALAVKPINVTLDVSTPAVVAAIAKAVSDELAKRVAE